MDRPTIAKKLCSLGNTLESLGFILLERELNKEEQDNLKQTLRNANDLLDVMHA